MAVIANLSISRLEAVGLLVLFSVQLALPIPTVRRGFAVAYLVLAVGMIALMPGVRRSLIGSVRYALPGRRR